MGHHAGTTFRGYNLPWGSEQMRAIGSRLTETAAADVTGYMISMVALAIVEVSKKMDHAEVGEGDFEGMRVLTFRKPTDDENHYYYPWPESVGDYQVLYNSLRRDLGVGPESLDDPVKAEMLAGFTLEQAMGFGESTARNRRLEVRPHERKPAGMTAH